VVWLLRNCIVGEGEGEFVPVVLTLLLVVVDWETIAVAGVLVRSKLSGEVDRGMMPDYYLPA
jgi:hypothetical protein